MERNILVFPTSVYHISYYSRLYSRLIQNLIQNPNLTYDPKINSEAIIAFRVWFFKIYFKFLSLKVFSYFHYCIWSNVEIHKEKNKYDM